MKQLHIFYTSVSTTHDRLLNTRTGKVKSLEKLMGPTFEKYSKKYIFEGQHLHYIFQMTSLVTSIHGFGNDCWNLFLGKENYHPNSFQIPICCPHK